MIIYQLWFIAARVLLAALFVFLDGASDLVKISTYSILVTIQLIFEMLLMWESYFVCAIGILQGWALLFVGCVGMLEENDKLTR